MRALFNLDMQQKSPAEDPAQPGGHVDTAEDADPE
jgi:hypothetical protein